MELSEKERQFIIGLEKLTRETGITIKAESYDKVDLSLYPANTESNDSGYGFVEYELMWIDPSDSKLWNNHKHEIIKYCGDNEQDITTTECYACPLRNARI